MTLSYRKSSQKRWQTRAGIVNLKDIAKPKLTLPTIYAISQSEGDVYDQLICAFGKASTDVPDCTRIKELLFGIGAIQYAETNVEYHKLRARNILLGIASEGVNIDQLRALFS